MLGMDQREKYKKKRYVRPRNQGSWERLSRYRKRHGESMKQEIDSDAARPLSFTRIRRSHEQERD
jgi:hypothetical protein